MTSTNYYNHFNNSYIYFSNNIIGENILFNKCSEINYHAIKNYLDSPSYTKNKYHRIKTVNERLKCFRTK